MCINVWLLSGFPRSVGDVRCRWVTQFHQRLINLLKIVPNKSLQWLHWSGRSGLNNSTLWSEPQPPRPAFYLIHSVEKCLSFRLVFEKRSASDETDAAASDHIGSTAMSWPLTSDVTTRKNGIVFETLNSLEAAAFLFWFNLDLLSSRSKVREGGSVTQQSSD